MPCCTPRCLAAAASRVASRALHCAACAGTHRLILSHHQHQQRRQHLRASSSYRRHNSSGSTMQRAAGYPHEPWTPEVEAKLVSPAADRNKEPILAQLQRLLPASGGLVLEVASGTGQHVAHFAAALAQQQPAGSLTWQPTDVTPECFGSIAAYTAGLANVRPPLVLDASAPVSQWPKLPEAPVAVIAANVCHISPWPVTLGLVAGAAQLLAPGGVLFIYGPFTIDGAFTSESNERFHNSLVAQDPRWGYRDAADVTAAAAAAGLSPEGVLEMPANNHVLLFRKKPAGAG